MDLTATNGSATPQADAGASPDTGTVAAEGGNIPAAGGEASAQGATPAESFLPADLNTLPPQVRAIAEKINADMVRGFTSKAEKLAAEKKALEAFRQKADMYDQMLGDPRFAEYWNGQKKGGQPAESQSDFTDEEFAQAFANRDNFLGFLKKFSERQSQGMLQRLEEAQKNIRRMEASEAIQAFASARDEKGQPLYPDFERLENLKLDGDVDLVSVFLQLTPETPGQPGDFMSRLQTAYKGAKQFYDRVFEEGKKAGMGNVQRKLNFSSQPPSVTPNGSVFAGDPTKIDEREAWRLAKQGIVVPRN